MKIAILGWGSLIWDIRPEFDDQHDKWLLDGPKLTLEFSRISKTRGGALTLVVDETNGTPCPVAYTMSKRQNPDDAICDLRSREGTTLCRIGYYFADGSRQGEPQIPDIVRKWTVEKRLDVVIWTGLPSNFEKECKESFSVDRAMSYLQGLSREGKSKAAEYFWRAPDFVDTPIRRAVEVEPWFQKN